MGSLNTVGMELDKFCNYLKYAGCKNKNSKKGSILQAGTFITYLDIHHSYDILANEQLSNKQSNVIHLVITGIP